MSGISVINKNVTTTNSPMVTHVTDFTTPMDTNDTNRNFTTGEIAGIVIAVLLFIGLIAFVFIYKIKKRKQDRGNAQGPVDEEQNVENVNQNQGNENWDGNAVEMEILNHAGENLCSES